jgi:rubrerythrin
MGEFLKCECSHCGQPIEYPSDGTGQTIPCPTCDKPVILTPVNSPAPDSYVANVRAEPATEKQKEKLSFFGCVPKAGMTKGEASDALEECVRQFPQRNVEYYNRPATEEQLTELQKINAQCEPEEPFYDFEEAEPLTYGRAKDILQEWVWHQREKAQEEESAYLESDESRIDEVWMRLGDSVEVARDEVARAWSVAKSNMADNSEPDLHEIEDTLEELFPHIRKQSGYCGVYRCKDCAVTFKVRLPVVNAANMSVRLGAKDDLTEVMIPCPGCGRDKSVISLKICKYICPDCSKECFVPQSHTGQQVKHFGCSNSFFATPKELSKVDQKVRLMHYIE